MLANRSPARHGRPLARAAASLLIGTTASLLFAVGARGQAVPTPTDVLGAEAGARFTDTGDVARYLAALDAASDRALLRPFGRTPEGRALVAVVLSSPGHLARLEELLAERARLDDPDLAPGEAARIARSTPAVAWLMYGVHGDESSSTEAALWTAHDLASGAPGTDGILDSLIVVIEPVANPDGRDRYVGWFRGVSGAAPNPEPASVEHRQPWPGGRGNHYLFDLNRDWTWATQPETRARIAEWARWRPQVHVDFHEMGVESSYFFFPASVPINPVYPEYTVRWGDYFGRALAEEFDRRRWLYFTAERFDLFYPGYGDSWPSLAGAIGMTFEQAGGGSAGLAVRRPDGSLLTLAERLEHHRVAGLTTLRAAAARKTALQEEYAGFHRELGEGWPDVLLVPGPDPQPFAALAETLARQGIRVETARRDFEASVEAHAGFAPRRSFPAGTIRVPGRQARGRLALTLLQSETRLDRNDATSTYDLTAWSLPYAFGVEAHTARGRLPDVFAGGPPADGADAAGPDGGAEGGPLPYGWLVYPSLAAVGPVYRWLASGGRALALEAGFEIEGRAWPAGTRFLPADAGALARLDAVGLRETAVPVRTGWTENGRDLGSPWSLELRAGKIGVFRGSGVSSSSYGFAWNLLEAVLRIPFDALDLADLGRLDLDEWDVLVLPDGRPGRELDSASVASLRGWLDRGGTLVASGGSASWAGDALADVKRRREDDSLSTEERRRRALRTREERRTDSWDEAVNGVILPVGIDAGHPLAWGVGTGNAAGRAFVLHIDDLSFEPDDSFETVISFAEDLAPVSGVVSPEKVAGMAASSWLAVADRGRGRVVLFADDPLFRLMWPSNFLPFANALLQGPAMH